MRDEETGSWWQQVTGEAIHGPLKGQRLRSVFHDELTFGLWRREKPQGRVLLPDEKIAQAGKYAPANWEERMARVPVATAFALDKSLEPRTLVIGLTVNGVSKAYPFNALLKQSLILDKVGGVPIFIVLGDDKKSVRAYERSPDGRTLEFFVKSNSASPALVDAETGSEWDFTGKAIGGALTGRQLKKVAVLNDYWFDWQTYHPQTLIYDLGNR
ncbi:MAG: hypothetical protein QOD75_4049 [Blastocatellia bacterium]|nr:hypothetical protein [Blastocatellia bacterium]